MSVALVLTGIANWKTLDPDSPVAVALKMPGLQPPAPDRHGGSADGNDLVAAGWAIRAGAHLVRDVARPASAGMFSEGTQGFRTPYISTWIAGFVVGLPAGLVGHRHVRRVVEYRDPVRIHRGVGAAVIVLRKKQPERPRSFRVPFVPLVPILSIVCCLVLMMGLPLLTWIRFFVWLAIGLVIYFLYSRHRTAVSEH